jgi:heme A synthase
MKEQLLADEYSLNKQAFGLIIALCLQYVLGITTTLFVQLPRYLPEGQIWEFAWKQVPLALHMILGLFLLLGSTALLIRSIKSNSQTWIVASIVGLVSLLITSFSGSLFVDRKSDLYSYIMAVGFIVTLFSYIWGIFASKNELLNPPSHLSFKH